MGKLFFHAGVFATFTLIVYFVCMWFVKLSAESRKRRGRKV